MRFVIRRKSSKEHFVVGLFTLFAADWLQQKSIGRTQPRIVQHGRVGVMARQRGRRFNRWVLLCTGCGRK